MWEQELNYSSQMTEVSVEDLEKNCLHASNFVYQLLENSERAAPSHKPLKVYGLLLHLQPSPPPWQKLQLIPGKWGLPVAWLEHKKTKTKPETQKWGKPYRQDNPRSIQLTCDCAYFSSQQGDVAAGSHSSIDTNMLQALGTAVLPTCTFYIHSTMGWRVKGLTWGCLFAPIYFFTH